MSALLALFVRSLRQDTRGKVTYWGRAGLVLVMLLLLALVHTSSGWIGAPGLQFFQKSIFVNLFFISLAGLSYFASAITEEKEEMTLGLLRMTNLNPLSILLGKSTSRLCGALLLLAAQFPFTFLAVAFGGVSVGQIVAAYSTLAAYLFLLSNLALLFSVISRRTAGAAIFTAAALFIYLAGYAILPAGLRLLTWMHLIESAAPGPRLGGVLAAWRSSSPLERLGTILKTGFHDGPVGVQVIGNLAAGGILFLIAWAAFNAFNAEQLEAAPARGPVAQRNSRFPFLSAGRAWRRALLWKDFHFLGGGRAATFIKFVLYGLVLACVVLSPEGVRPIRWQDAGFTMMALMAVAVGIELTFAAGRMFRQEWRWKTLSSLAMLPVSIRSIAHQKILAALLASWPGVFYFCIGLVCASEAIWDFLANALIAPNAARMFQAIAPVALAFSIVQCIFFLHLVANLSLRVKWGAVPLALAISYVFSIFIAMGAIVLFGSAEALIIPVAALVIASGVLHVNTGARLEQLAAEE